MTIKTADVTHLEECLRNFGRCQKDEEPFLVMNALYNGVLDRGKLCLVQAELTLFERSETSSSTFHGMGNNE